jgi:hypothetical protein
MEKERYREQKRDREIERKKRKKGKPLLSTKESMDSNKNRPKDHPTITYLLRKSSVNLGAS